MTSAERSPRPDGPGPTIAFLPLDERSVNIGLPAGIAAIAGAELILPPRELLPRIRQAGDADRLGRWLGDAAAGADAVVASIDMLCYGGLIASRTGTDSTLTVLSRLETLRALRRDRPELPIAGVSLVMRASDSYNQQEEPDYWSRFGRELHRLGALHHRDLLAALGAEMTDAEPDSLAGLRAALPADVLADFEGRRLRNHQINLQTLLLAADGIVDPLLITADDTAEFAAGTMEQIWLRQWSTILPIAGEVQMYPGADEVAAVLVARTLAALLGIAARFTVECADPPGLERIANYENSPLRVAIDRQIRASGAALTDDSGAMALVIHAPDPRRRDLCGNAPSFDEADASEAERTADLVARLLANGRAVALADLRYSNGADALLIEALARRGILLDLVAYGGWNTAGNALGSVIAAAAAWQIAEAAGTLDRVAAQRMLLHRLIEDYGYQAIIRAQFDAGMRSFEPADEVGAAELVRTGLQAILTRLSGRNDLVVTDVTFPWHRSFEIDFAIGGDLS